MALDLEAVEVDPLASYPIVGVLNRGRGLLHRRPIPGSGTKYKSLFRIRPGQVVYSRLKAFEGAITVAPDGLGESFASQEFPTFTCGDGLLPEYFSLVTTTPRLWSGLQHLSTGMGGRRERVKPSAFLTFRLRLPSVAEQRRIVDLLAKVDGQIEALETQITCTQGVRSATLANLEETCEPEEERTLGDLVAESGGSIQTGPFGTALKAAEYSETGVPVISTGEVRKGRIVVHAKTPRVGPTVTNRLPKYLLKHGDIVFARKGAVDRSAWVQESQTGYFLGSDGIRVRLEGSVLDSRFIAYVLQTPSIIRWLEIHATGTIMRGLNQKILWRIPIHLPLSEVRHRFVDSLLCLDALTEREDEELGALRTLRSSLLTAILSQSISIPQSYDSMLEVTG